MVAVERGGNAEPCAVVILRAKGELEPVVKRANESLAEYQRMRMWTEWPQEDFPRTNTQKPKRQVVADFVRARIERPPSTALGLAESSPLGELISRVAGRSVAALPENARLDSDLGLSSLDRVELLGALEDRYQLDLSETRFSSVRTVGDLERMLRGDGSPTDAYHYPRWVLRWPVTWIRLLAHYLLMRPAIVLL